MFENFNVQAGNDESGVPTDMLSLNSTVKILYRNPATFFAVHVTSSPVELHYFQLKVASGQVKIHAHCHHISTVNQGSNGHLTGISFSWVKVSRTLGVVLLQP